MAERLVARIYHDYYGCETGCCGHVVELTNEAGQELHRRFEFEHLEPAEVLEFTQAVVREHWPDCYESIDWASLQVDQINGYGAGC